MRAADNNGVANSIEADAAALVMGLRAGERRIVARVATEFERRSALGVQILRLIEAKLGRALVVGITGPPGAGKSTLVNAMIVELRRRGGTVGVIAVDPSSPISGGAILGDRIRMTAAAEDDGVFVRSLASKGNLGGLTPAAVRIIDALDGAGFDTILLETVGTGQSEIDVAEIADVRIVVAAPGLGDDIQAMKSGLLEIADVLVVNKGDRPGAEATLQQLSGALSVRSHHTNGHRTGEVEALKTTATTGAGVPRLVDAALAIGQTRLEQSSLTRRRRRARYLIARACADLIADRIRNSATGELDHAADEVLSGFATAESIASRLVTVRPSQE
jgi:LAO/AO transport system kinase